MKQSWIKSSRIFKVAAFASVTPGQRCSYCFTVGDNTSFSLTITFEGNGSKTSTNAWKQEEGANVTAWMLWAAQETMLYGNLSLCFVASLWQPTRDNAIHPLETEKKN